MEEGSQTPILILEDDDSLGSALKEILSRAGHKVYLCARPDAAMNTLSQHKIEFLFCDCLLPQMTGVDFVMKARAGFPNMKFKSVLMSGIYTDKVFIQEALQKTQAITFLQKPFRMEDVLDIVAKESTPRKDDVNARKVLYQTFSNPSVSARQKRKLIESLEEISGFDLPFIYSLLVETKSSGYLNIYHGNGSVSGVTFSEGQIVGVDVEDKTTYIGEMLIQSGYANVEDVRQALKDKNNRRLGQQMILANQLSPHGFDIILAEQMNIRLSRTIVEEKLRINFASTEVEMVHPSLDSEALTEFLHDWIASKISLSWLKSLYIMWSGYVIAPSPNMQGNMSAYEMSLTKSLDALATHIEKRMTLNQLLSLPGYNEKALYKAVHFLLTKGLIVFEQKSSFNSEEEQLQALRKIQADVQNKNNVEMIEYMEVSTMNSGGGDIVLADFLGLLGTTPKNENSEAFKLWSKVKAKAQEAVQATADSKMRDELKQASAKSDAEVKLKANQLLEEAKQALHLNQYTKANALLLELGKLKTPDLPQIHLYTAWTKLGLLDPSKKQPFFLKEIEMEIIQVPPDEKYDFLFPFVIGLFNRAKGDFVSAQKSFEKSIAMDSSFIVARRELNLLMSQNKKQDILKMDLKDMVSGFFKKR